MHVEVLLLCFQILVESLFGSFDDSKSVYVFAIMRSLEPSPEGIVLNLSALCISYCFIQ